MAYYNKQRGNKKQIINKFASSVLRPFDTEPIKPYFDYPLCTSLYEKTYEMVVPATLSGAANCAIPVGTYGVAISILPHAYNAFTVLQS